MAQYDITKEIKEIATLKNITPEEAAVEIGFYNCETDWTTVWNRADQSKISRVLADLKESIKKESVKEERASGYRWINHPTGWAVDGDFTDKKIGDVITVTKASGERQEKQIVRFTGDGKAKVL